MTSVTWVPAATVIRPVSPVTFPSATCTLIRWPAADRSAASVGLELLDPDDAEASDAFVPAHPVRPRARPSASRAAGSRAGRTVTTGTPGRGRGSVGAGL